MAHSLFYPVKRPPLALLGVEPWRTAFEFLSHKVTPHSQPVIGDGHSVLIFPGLGADGRSVEPLRKFCESLGYSAFDWSLGFNKGPQVDVDTWLSGLAKHSSDLLNDH